MALLGQRPRRWFSSEPELAQRKNDFSYQKDWSFSAFVPRGHGTLIVLQQETRSILPHHLWHPSGPPCRYCRRGIQLSRPSRDLTPTQTAQSHEASTQCCFNVKATLGQRLVFAGKPLSHTAVTDWVITHAGPGPWRKRDVNSKLILVYNNISVVIECIMCQASFVHRVGRIGSLGIPLGMTSILIYEITPYFNSSIRDSCLITIPANTGR